MMQSPKYPVGTTPTEIYQSPDTGDPRTQHGRAFKKKEYSTLYIIFETSWDLFQLCIF